MGSSLLRVCAVAAALATTFSLPIPTAHADAPSPSGDTPPGQGTVAQPAPGYHLETRDRRDLAIGGAVTFGLSFGLAATSAAGLMFISDRIPPAGNGIPFGDVAWLFLPVAGPFLQMPKAGGNGTVNALLALDGLGQIVGATLIVVGLAWPKTIVVRDVVRNVHIVPLKVSGGGGLGLVGTL
jgi:hypothetical protein